MREKRAVAPSPAEDQIEARETHGAQRSVATGPAVPRGARSIGTLILARLAIVYTLYLDKEIVLPSALALVMKLLLAPAMRLLHEKLRLPEALAADNAWILSAGGSRVAGRCAKRITKVFRASTSSGVVIPRVFQDDTPEDKQAVQSVLRRSANTTVA